MSNFKKNQAGFTLVETLVSVLLFAITLTAVSAVLISNNANANLIRDNFIANGLVQEGVEVVRNIRDQGWFNGSSFDSSIPNGSWQVDLNTTSLNTPFNSNNFIKKDSATGVFGYATGGNTIFTRQIDVSTVRSDIEKRVVVTIQWTERGTVKTLSAEEHLFNWK